MNEPSAASPSRSFVAPMLGVLVLFVALVAYLDRRTLLLEKQILQEEVWTMDARLQAASDAVELRQELERQAREIDRLRHATGAATQAMEASREVGARVLPLVGPTPARGWIVLPAARGTAYLVLRDVPRPAEGVEVELEAVVGGASRQVARLAPFPDGRAATAFSVDGPPEALTAAYLRLLLPGASRMEAPLLAWEAEKGAPER